MVIGPKMHACAFENKTTKAKIGTQILNKMNEHGLASFELVTLLTLVMDKGDLRIVPHLYNKLGIFLLKLGRFEMRITLFGATGAVGGYFLNKALTAGHEVTALVRSPEKLDAQPNLRALKGDVTNVSDVRDAIDQADVVVSCLGNVKSVLIMEKAADAILQAAAAQPAPPRCLFVSSIGCGGSSWVVLQLLRLIAGRAVFADYERADARIAREANVPYVLIRPAALKEKPGTGKYRVFQGDGTFARPMAKEDVASFLIDAVGSDQWDGKGGFQLAGCK